MTFDTPAQRLVWARKKHGKYNSGTDAARAFGWPVSTYLGHENGDRNPSLGAAKKYAKTYKVRWEWILEGEGPPTVTMERGVAAVPLISWVSAGELADADSQLPLDDVPLLAVADLGVGEFFGLRVENDSMDRFSPPGSIIIVNREDRELVGEKSYVFSVRGETTYKRWHPDPPYLEPWSTNPANKPIFIKRLKELDVVGRVWRTVLDL